MAMIIKNELIIIVDIVAVVGRHRFFSVSTGVIGIAFVVVVVIVIVVAAVVLLSLTCFTYACSVVCLFVASSSSMKAPAGRQIAESTGVLSSALASR